MAKILLVDDEPDFAFLLQKRLKRAGHECVWIDNVEEALAKLCGICPDLVLLDLCFKGANGTAFLKNCRGCLKCHPPTLPVMVMSSYVNQEIQMYVEEEGAACFIAKPYDPDEFLAMIDGCLRGQKVAC